MIVGGVALLAPHNSHSKRNMAALPCRHLSIHRWGPKLYKMLATVGLGALHPVSCNSTQVNVVIKRV